MKECFIGCGEFNYFYLYVLYCILTHFIVHSLISLDSLNKVFDVEFFFELILNKHPFVESLYQYLGFIFFGLLFYFFFVVRKKKTKNSKDNKDKKENEGDNSNKSDSLIYNDINRVEISNASVVKLLIVCFLLFFQMEIYDILYSFNFYDFDFWIFNIIFTLIFMYKIFKIKPFQHHYLSLIFIILIGLILILIATFIPDKTTGGNAYKNVEKVLIYQLFAIFIILFFIIISCSTAFARVEVKKIMEIKYISPLKLIILIGFIGLIITSLSLVISSNVECKEGLKDYCKVYLAENSQTKYYDSFPIYISNLNARDTTKFWIEISILYPLIIFGRFIKFYFELLILYYLNPVFVLISDDFYYAIKNLFFILQDDAKVYLKIPANIVAIIGYCIYLEIIELRFCGLNKNLRKHIRKRSKTDNEIEFGEIGFANDNENEDNNSIFSS